MVRQGRGGGQTPERVVALLQNEVKKSSQAATARATGLALQTIQRYIKGIGEPSQATLEILAIYFGKSVAWLRGEGISANRAQYGLEDTISLVKVADDLIKLYYLAPDELKETIWLVLDEQESYINETLTEYVAGIEEENEKLLMECLKRIAVINSEMIPHIKKIQLS